MTIKDGIAQGRSDDRACSPPWPVEAKRRCVRGLNDAWDVVLKSRVDLRRVERSMAWIGVDWVMDGSEVDVSLVEADQFLNSLFLSQRHLHCIDFENH